MPVDTDHSVNKTDKKNEKITGVENVVENTGVEKAIPTNEIDGAKLTDLNLVSACSRTLTACEKRYSVSKLESLAVVYGLSIYSWYLMFATRTLIYTDSRSLVFLKLARQSSPILNRFAIYISNFSVEMRHIRGCDNYLADALSRNVKDEDSREKPQYLTEKQSHDIVDRLVLTPGTFFSDKVVQKLLLGIVPELPLGGAVGKKPRRTASLAKITAESTKPNQKTARVPPVPNSAYEKGTFPIRKGPRKKKGPRLKDVETPAVMMTFFAQLYPQFEENKRKSEANKIVSHSSGAV
jgi:hypothetical protein